LQNGAVAMTSGFVPGVAIGTVLGLAIAYAVDRLLEHPTSWLEHDILSWALGSVVVAVALGFLIRAPDKNRKSVGTTNNTGGQAKEPGSGGDGPSWPRQSPEWP
jgi:hypothetical protein